MESKIQPVSVFPDIATSFRVTNVLIRQLGTKGSSHISWSLLSEKDRVLKSGTVEMSGIDYDTWGLDDKYVMEFALKKLGLTVKL